MPYRWLPSGDGATAELQLWPHRSLPVRGFVWFMGGTAAALALPLVALIGSPVLWGVLPFVLAVIWALWSALRRSYRDGEVIETLRMGPDRIALTRRDPGGATREWTANPYWVTVHLDPDSGPVPQYLTLKGAGREVELGAFLGPEERLRLRGELERALGAARG